jgi:hypothetical protein
MKIRVIRHPDGKRFITKKQYPAPSVPSLVPQNFPISSWQIAYHDGAYWTFCRSGCLIEVHGEQDIFEPGFYWARSDDEGIEVFGDAIPPPEMMEST